MSDEIKAPRIVPGIESKPSFKPSEYSILRCFAYEIDDATELLNTAKILLLAARAGGNPKNVKTGTIIIPPPNPIMEPNNPATNPRGSNQSSSIIVIVNKEFYLYIGLFI